MEGEPVDQFVPVAEIDPTMYPSEQRQRFGSRQRRPEGRLTGYEAQSSIRLDGLALAVAAKIGTTRS